MAEAVALHVGTAQSLSVAGAYSVTGGPGFYDDTAGKGTAAPPGAVPTAILASSQEFQDARAASMVCYHTAVPLLLTPATVEAAPVAKTGVAVLRIAGEDDTDAARELARRYEAARSTAGLGWTPGWSAAWRYLGQTSA